jgi:ubiquinone/menaquinone biosynthesis C-methylase UbiE
MGSQSGDRSSHGAEYIQHVIDYYHERSKVYDQGLRRNIIPKALRSVAWELSEVKPGEEVLDLCTGTGQSAAWFARSGAKVTGIDLSEDMLSIASAKHQDIEFRAMDAAAVDYPDKSFDIVNIQMGLHDMPIPIIAKVLGEINRLARRVVVISEPCPPKNRLLKVIYRYAAIREFKEASDWIGYTNLDLRKAIRESGLHIEAERSFNGIYIVYRCRPTSQG